MSEISHTDIEPLIHEAIGLALGGHVGLAVQVVAVLADAVQLSEELPVVDALAGVVEGVALVHAVEIGRAHV